MVGILVGGGGGGGGTGYIGSHSQIIGGPGGPPAPPLFLRLCFIFSFAFYLD